MKLRQSNPFTLIELLIVIGIIGILATVVVPSVGDALTSAKRTAAQVACKTFEEDMVKYDATNSGEIKSASKTLTGLALYQYLSGQTDKAGVAITGVEADDDHTVGTGAGAYFEARISDSAFDMDESGFLPTALTTTEAAAPFVINKFGNSFQFVMRTSADAGTIVVQNPLGAALTLTNFKRGDMNLRVVCFDDSDPLKLISKDGVYNIVNPDGTTIAQGGTDAAGTFKLELQ